MHIFLPPTIPAPIDSIDTAASGDWLSMRLDLFLRRMCLKGGMSLRKVFARIPSRFSRDVDFVDASYQQLSDKGLSPEEYYYELLDAFDGQTIFDIQWKVKPLTEAELATDSLRVDLNYVSVRNLPKSLVHA